ncbi:MAG: hypothetical protein AB1589_27745 [Cyanobacteriota bacterium]
MVIATPFSSYSQLCALAKQRVSAIAPRTNHSCRQEAKTVDMTGRIA